ncbi:Franean1_4349 family RiPP [Geomonas sp. Red32]|uniref:Franean1_4349 family RiPP n=1 Tax=Geomonas sp. Red32 TaxID=2912856 RepID=UPI00202CF243|nr:Os1348 family NHLP clan protein [Geomonas sp. Red32]MCM0082402.1 Franean1_4349 family RiPP [Geomonas sp. Red32]
MSQDAVEKFLGRLLTDDTFRNLAARAPQEACRSYGYPLTDEEIGAIKAEHLALIALVSIRLDSSIKRFCTRAGIASQNQHNEVAS